MNYHKLVTNVKRALYGSRGEPYSCNGKTLYFVPGTRPVRAKYKTSSNVVNRHDALQIDYFSRHISRGANCLDVGAHTGECAVLMSALSGPQGYVVCFEPDPNAVHLLKANIALNRLQSFVTIEEIAVSDCVGTQRLYNANGGSNATIKVVNGLQEESSRDVPTITIDAYLHQAKLPPPDFVKIDIEGAEVDALSEAKSVLASNADILVELHPFAWGDVGSTYRRFLDLIDEHGRQARYLDEEKPIGRDPKYGTVVLEKIRAVSK